MNKPCCYSNYQTKSVFLTLFFILLLVFFWSTSPKTYNDILPTQVSSNTPDIAFVISSQEGAFDYINLITPNTDRNSLNADKVAVFVETGSHLDKVQWRNRNSQLINNPNGLEDRKKSYEDAQLNRLIQTDYISQFFIFIALILLFISVSYLFKKKK